MIDLETALRDTLTARAGDIAQLPPHLASAGLEGDADYDAATVVRLRPHRVTWTLVAAAAAVVALITGVVTAVLVTGDGSTPPADRTTVRTVLERACPTTIPASWTAAARAATSPTPASYIPSAVTGDGSLVYTMTARTFTVVRLQAAGSQQLKTLDRIGGFGLGGAGTANVDVSVSGDWIAVTVERGDRAAVPVYIEAIDLASGRRVIVWTPARPEKRDNGADQLASAGYVQDGVVYWQTRATDGTGLETVYAQDLATGRKSVVGPPAQYRLAQSAAGITWHEYMYAIGYTGGIDRPAPVPDVISPLVRRSAIESVVSDGSSWAWASPNGDLVAWDPALGHIVRVSGLLRPIRSGAPGGRPVAVAGPLVVYSAPSGAMRVVDLRTGATAPASAPVFGSQGELIGAPIGSGNDDSAVMRLTPADLLALRC